MMFFTFLLDTAFLCKIYIQDSLHFTMRAIVTATQLWPGLLLLLMCIQSLVALSSPYTNDW